MPTLKSKSKSSGEFRTPEALQDWGRRLGRRLKGGDTVALIGTLGAGKTTLVQGIARAWGYPRRANSPTFALVNEYSTARGTLLHMDVYRLSETELWAFPFEEYLDSRSVCLIEWADRMRERWPAETLELRLSAPSPSVRQVEICQASETWRERLSKL